MVYTFLKFETSSKIFIVFINHTCINSNLYSSEARNLMVPGPKKGRSHLNIKLN